MGNLVKIAVLVPRNSLRLRVNVIEANDIRVVSGVDTNYIPRSTSSDIADRYGVYPLIAL